MLKLNTHTQVYICLILQLYYLSNSYFLLILPCTPEQIGVFIKGSYRRKESCSEARQCRNITQSQHCLTFSYSLRQPQENYPFRMLAEEPVNSSFEFPYCDRFPSLCVFVIFLLKYIVVCWDLIWQVILYNRHTFSTQEHSNEV